MWTQTSKCSTDITDVIVSNITSCQRKQNIRNRYTNKSTFYFSKKSNKKLFSWFDIWKHVADVAANSASGFDNIIRKFQQIKKVTFFNEKKFKIV